MSQEPHRPRGVRVAGDQPEGAEDYHPDRDPGQIWQWSGEGLCNCVLHPFS